MIEERTLTIDDFDLPEVDEDPNLVGLLQGAPLEQEESYEALKRGFDIFSASLLLSLLSPVMLCTWLLVRLSSRGPAIYTQRRLTQHARLFHMYKFRTMVQDAERGSGAVWAKSSDPRVTKVGRFLRLTRLDELPQLVNVLIGDMSLIGPRPERPEIADELQKDLPAFEKRLQVKAGLTGLAQISSGYAANLEGYQEKLAWDLLYIKHRSFALDLRICLRTVRVVLTGSGAR